MVLDAKVDALLSAGREVSIVSQLCFDPPTLVRLFLLYAFFWDGRVVSIHSQLCFDLPTLVRLFCCMLSFGMASIVSQLRA